MKTHTSTSSVYRKHPARRKQRMMRNKMINKMSLKLRLHRLVFHIMSTKFQSNIYIHYDSIYIYIIIKVCLYLKLCFGSLHNRRRLTLVRERTNNQRYAQPCRGEIIEDRCSCSIFETQLSSTRVLDLQSKCEDYKYVYIHMHVYIQLGI